MRRFILNHLDPSSRTATLTGQEARHLSRVLRLGPGAVIQAADGLGRLFNARVTRLEKETVHLAIVNDLSDASESELFLTVGQGMLKDKKMDFLIRHLTELGMTRWVPFFAERSVPRPDTKRLQARMERWQKIAMEALKQCNRTLLPEISDPLDFKTLLAMSDTADQRILFWEEENAAISPPALSEGRPKHVMLLIGPEGGFTREEVDRARQKGFVSASLGPRILRAETAAIAACTLAQFLFGDLGPKKGLTPS